MRYIWIYILIAAVLIIGGWYVWRPKAPSAPAQTPIAVADFLCREGKYLSVAFFRGQAATTTPEAGVPPTPTGYVEVRLSDGRDLTLQQTISADGARFANPDESFVFWAKGSGALVLENNQSKSYIGCVLAAPGDTGFNAAYLHQSPPGFSIILPALTSTSTPNPAAYTVDESYKYDLAQKGQIYGVKFTVPQSKAAGTNLGNDSYLSVETIPQVRDCSASLFLHGQAKAVTMEQNGFIYSVASTTNVAAGNSYEETVYAMPGTNMCMAVRYFIHYSAFENYPPGTVKRFDEQALKGEFDKIRSTLRVVE